MQERVIQYVLDSVGLDEDLDVHPPFVSLVVLQELFFIAHLLEFVAVVKDVVVISTLLLTAHLSSCPRFFFVAVAVGVVGVAYPRGFLTKHTFHTTDALGKGLAHLVVFAET